MATYEAAVMNRMVCEDCRAVFFSAAARTLVEQGERCAVCSGILRLEPEPGRDARVGVAHPQEHRVQRADPADRPDGYSRRFYRDRGDGF